MVSGDEEGVGGGEGEVVLVGEAGGDGVAAGECFDFGFVEAVSFVEFLGDDEALSDEAGEFGGVLGEALFHEEAGGGAGGVVAEDGGDGFEEDGFSVAAGSVGEGEDVFADFADGGVADEALHVFADGSVGEGGGEEVFPLGAVGVGVGGGVGGFGVEFGGVGVSEFTVFEVDDAVGGVEFPGVVVEVVEGGGGAGCGAGLDEGVGDAGGGEGAFFPLFFARVGFGEGACGVFGEFACCGVGAALKGPAVAGPVEPLSAVGVVAELVAVVVDEAVGVAVVGFGEGGGRVIRCVG